MTKKSAVESKHYNLKLPDEVFNRLRETAEERGMAIVDLIRIFIKVGFIVLEADKNADSKLIIREGECERELTLLY